jgi:hypothetical protein
MTLGSCSVISISILCRQRQRRLGLIDVVTSVSSSFATSYRHFPTRRRIARKESHSGRKIFPRRLREWHILASVPESQKKNPISKTTFCLARPHHNGSRAAGWNRSLIDRIDIDVAVPAMELKDLTGSTILEEPSPSIRDRVTRARWLCLLSESTSAELFQRMLCYAMRLLL